MTVTTGGRGWRSDSSPSSSPNSMSNVSSNSRSSSSGETTWTLKLSSAPSSCSVSSLTDWVAVTISPRWNSTWTRDAGLTPILSAKSLSEAPRDSRIAWPLPRGICTPPIDGACMLSNSWRRCLRDLRPRDGRPPGRPNAPWVPLRPRPPAPPGRPPPPPPTPPGRGAPPPPPPPGRGPAPGPPRPPPGRAPVPGPPRLMPPPGPPRPPAGRGGMLLGLGRGPPGRGPPGRATSAGDGRPEPPPGRGPPAPPVLAGLGCGRGDLAIGLSCMGLLRTLRRERFFEPADDGRLDRGGRRPHELAHLLELGHHGLALYAELLRELVNPDLRHCAPSTRSGIAGPSGRPGREAPAGVRFCCSSPRSHRALITIGSCFPGCNAVSIPPG